MAYRKDWIQPQVGPMGFANTQKTIGRVVTITTADNVTANTIGAFKVPAGFTVTGIIVVATDMDSGAAMLLNIGDAALATRYFTGLNTQAAITTQTLAATGLLFLNTVDTEILITVATQAGTAVAGTVALYLTGFMAQ
jgi:hypothetical protein